MNTKASYPPKSNSKSPCNLATSPIRQVIQSPRDWSKTATYRICKRFSWREDVWFGALYSNLWEPSRCWSIRQRAFFFLQNNSVAAREICRNTRISSLAGEGTRFRTVCSRCERSDRPEAGCSLRDDMPNCSHAKMGPSGGGGSSCSPTLPFLHTLHEVHRMRTDRVCLKTGCAFGNTKAISIKCHTGGQY